MAVSPKGKKYDFTIFYSSPENGMMGQIIKTTEPFEPSYVPPALPHRENEEQEVLKLLARALRGKEPPPLIFAGSPGTGKTAIIKKALCELSQKQTKSAIFVYTDAFSPYDALIDIATAVKAKIPKKGTRLRLAWQQVERALKRRLLVVVLDDADRLLKTGEGVELLYLLTSRDRTGVVLIANEQIQKHIPDPRLISRLSARFLTFLDPYNVNELVDILTQRANLALRKSSYTPQLLRLCAALTMQGPTPGDARAAIKLLYHAAARAEEEGRRKITEKDLRMVAGEIGVDQKISGLPLLEKAVLYFVVCNPGARPGDILAKVNWRGLGLDPPSRSSLSLSLSKLVGEGLLEREVKGRGRGRGITVQLYPPEEWADQLKMKLRDELAETVKQQFTKH
jgi:cell division control protein 6